MSYYCSDSYYPTGAANDPSAPWNEEDECTCECEHCYGTGRIYTIAKVGEANCGEDGRGYECTKEEYDELMRDIEQKRRQYDPRWNDDHSDWGWWDYTDDELKAMNIEYVGGYYEGDKCPYCDGEGYVPDYYEPDPDERD